MTHAAKRINNDQIRKRHFFKHEAILWWSSKAQGGSAHPRRLAWVVAVRLQIYKVWELEKDQTKYEISYVLHKTFLDCPSFYKYFYHRYPLNVHAQLPRWTKGLVLGWSLHLRLYFVYANSECSDETAHMHMLFWFLAVHLRAYLTLTIGFTFQWILIGVW